MALAPNAAAVDSTGLGGIAQLISALAPIFIGSGPTNQNTTTASTGATNQNQTGTTSQTTVQSAPQNIIDALLASFNNAGRLATDPTATQALVDNIIRQSQLAFAPTIANANSAGLYNSSTLGLLAGNASAEAARQAAATVLNFQQGEQQIQSTIGGNLLNALKTTQTTGNTAQQTQGTTSQNQNTVGTSKTGASLGGALPLLLGAGSLLGGPALINNLFGTKIPGPIDLLKSLFSGGGSITNPEDPVQALAASLFGPPGTAASTLGLTGINASGFPSAFASGGGAGSVVGTAAATPALAADPTPLDIAQALAGLAIPGTGAQAITLGNVGATAINPQVGTLPDAFVNFTGSGTPAPLVGGIGDATGDATAVGTANQPLLQGGNIGLNATTAETLSSAGDVANALVPGFAGSVTAAGSTPEDVLAGLLGPAGTPGQAAGLSALSGAGALAGGAAPTIFGDLGSVGNFLLSSNPSSILNLPGHVGDLFSGGAGAAGNIAADLANPIAGILGSLAAGLINPNAKPVGAAIGSTVGGLAGGPGLAALGAPLGPVGVALGALIGSLAGGLIGPNPKNTYSFAGLKVNPDGTVALGNQITQAFGDSAGDLRNNLQSQVDSLNKLLTTANIRVSNATTTPSTPTLVALNGPGDFIIGDRGPLTLGIDQTKGTPQTPNLAPDLGGAFSQLRFSSPDSNLNALISGKSFSDPTQLVAALTGSAGASPAAPPSAAPAAPVASTPQVNVAQTVAPQQQPQLSQGQLAAAAFNPIFAANIAQQMGIIQPTDLAPQLPNPNLQSGGTG